MAQPSAFGLTSLYDPSIAVDQAALDRQMAMAQALRQQSLSAINPNRQIGGMGYRVSPWEVVAKAVQAYQAGNLERGTDVQRAELAQKSLMAMASMLRGTNELAPPADPNGGRPAGVSADAMQAGGFPQPAPGAAPQPAAQPANASFGLPQLLRGAAIESLGGTPAASAYWDNAKMPDAVKTMLATGQNPQAVGAATLGKLQKEANAPTRLGNSAYADSAGVIHGLPAGIEGSVNVPDPSVPGGFRTVPVPGAPEAMQTREETKQAAKAAFTATSGFDRGGNPTPITSVADLLRKPPPAAVVTPSQQQSRDVDRRKILQDELASETDPTNRKLIQRELDGTTGGKAYAPSGVYAAPPLGTESAQKGIDTSWEALKSASREAQNTKSYLQNIVGAADKGAIVGPNADRREMIQGLLQLAGIKESVNENAVSQTQLLDKYSNQIVTRLGQGGLGTDAARAMLQSAYPNKNMNASAIHEAAANLQGAQDMVQAKARYLLEPATKRDSTEYQKRELTFDQNADPRVFQWLAIKDPNQRKAFIQQALQQDPTFLDRAKTLREIGAIQ
jgi:hypothetical protein